MSLLQNLNEEFGGFCINVNKTILDKCVSLCEENDISAEDFVYGWIAYTSDKGVFHMTEFDLENMVRSKLSRRSKRLSTDVSAKVYKLKSDSDLTDSPIHDIISKSLSANSSSQKFAECSFSPSSYSPARRLDDRYTCRNSSGHVIASFGDESAADRWPLQVSTAVCVTPVSSSAHSVLDKPYSYMDEMALHVTHALNDRLCALGEQLVAAAWLHKQKSDSHEQPRVYGPGTLSQDEIYILGRICSEERTKLSQHSVALEGIIDDFITSSNKLVNLDVTALNDVGLFPGQIVLVRGNNPTGTKIYASEIITTAHYPLVPSVESCTKDSVPDPSSSSSISMIVACGPFTLRDNLQYEPLCDLLKCVSSHKPNLLVLQGPFVDESIVRVELAHSYEQLWNQLLDLVYNVISRLNTVVIVQASAAGILSDPVYPTPPLPIPTRMASRIISVSDPSSLDLDGHKMSLTSTDVLLHLAQRELKPTGTSVSDRLGRLASYLIGQKCFYPIYPPEAAMGVVWNRFSDHCSIHHKPDLFILPSDFKAFVKNVDGTIVVNPSKLVRGTSAGTYARIFLEQKTQTSAQIIKI